ncbi:protein DENND6B-like isoform X3 [Oncorhynchus keta]|uniref:protein DENND6B-like isoform X3 n=1 Tax=Oncorhynchus keta TaxID=8018 RepID=UPI0015F97006|nr:protein DENND6B-like isoform X3 [Oncorhynchus keta]
MTYWHFLLYSSWCSPHHVKLTEKERALAHFYGFVYFRQVEDATVKRGYFQKSLVLVSRLLYAHLFQSLLQIIAPEYFEKLEPHLEAVCNEIDQWQSPVPGLTLNLPVMGVVMQVRIPSKNDKPGGSPVKRAQKEVFPVLPDPPADPLGAHADRGARGHHGTLSYCLLVNCAGPSESLCDSGVTNPFFIKTFQVLAPHFTPWRTQDVR